MLLRRPSSFRAPSVGMPLSVLDLSSLALQKKLQSLLFLLGACGQEAKPDSSVHETCRPLSLANVLPGSCFHSYTFQCYQNKLFKHKYPSPILKIVKWLPNCLPTPLQFKALLISQASSCHTLQLTNWGRTGNALDLHQLTPAHA